ncbi:hypothetical protein IFM89_002278 [Coptis chinensis]|uniref:Uncharacterized protein n=1 Tax=Coptis chinensis TaxID=261450 RepID=A0A835IN18_9MAGN|nr:hypothetical protein IFM89_002278 [Coptis chinensis]
MDIDNTSKPINPVCKESYGRISPEEALVSEEGVLKNKMLGDGGVAGKKTDKSELFRRKACPCRRVLDEQFDDGVNDEEIRYLEKLGVLRLLRL